MVNSAKMVKSGRLICFTVLVMLTLTLLIVTNYKSRPQEPIATIYVDPNSNDQTDSRMSAAVSSRLSTLAANLMIPIIEKGVVNHTFPPQKRDHVTVDSMKMDSFSIGALDLRFAYPDAHNLTLSVIDVALTIPETKYAFSYGIFSCKGTFTASLNKTSVYINSKPYILQNNTLGLALEISNITWGNLDLNHKNDGFVCNIEESIARIFIGQINEFAAKNVREKLPKILSAELETRAQQLQWSIPSLFYELSMTKDRLFVNVDLLPEASPEPDAAGRRNVHVPSIYLQSLSSMREKLPPRDFVVDMPYASINHYLQRAQKQNLLNTTLIFPPGITTATLQYFFPEAHQLCPGCMLALMIAATDAPCVHYSSNRKSGFHVYNNSLELFVREARMGVVMLADTPQKSTAVQQALQRTRSAPRQLTGFLRRILKQMSLYPQWHNNLHAWIQKNVTYAPLNTIPLAFFSVDFVMGVVNVRFEGLHRNELCFDVMPLRDLNITLLETNIGTLNTTEIESAVLQVANLIVIPMLETRNWVKLPVVDGIFELKRQEMIVGANIPFF